MNKLALTLAAIFSMAIAQVAPAQITPPQPPGTPQPPGSPPSPQPPGVPPMPTPPPLPTPAPAPTPPVPPVPAPTPSVSSAGESTLAFPRPPGQPPGRPGRPDPAPQPGPRPGPGPDPQPPRPPGPPGPGRPDRPDQIVRLGGTRLSPIADADTIEVNSCAAGEDGRIDAIRIKAVQHTSRIDGVRVTYGNLNSDDISVSESIRPGQSTDWIDLGGRGRCVESVRVFGRSQSIGLKKATIDVFGLRHFRFGPELQDRREEK